MKKPGAISVLLLSLFAPASTVNGGPLRLVLLRDTTIQGDTIFLAHLLPSSAPLELRRRAESIPLGHAPELGSARAFSRAHLHAALEEANLVTSEFVIPESVVVRREADPLTRERVWLALRAAAAARGMVLPAKLRPEDIEWAAPVALPANNPRLEARQISFDRLLNQLRFQLRVSSNPSAPSFYAWCPLPQRQARQLAERPPVYSLGQPKSSLPSAAGLVSVRRRATLHLHSRNSWATLQVRVLQAGELGQTIRVRVPSNGHTLYARVMGPDLLDAVF